MRMSRIWLSVPCLVALILWAGLAGAQSTNLARFSGPVQVPGGVVLPAGSYTFAVTSDARSVVVSDANGRTLATLQVVAIHRAADGDIITMRSADGKTAPEVSAVYPRGGKDGYEFIYRRVQK